MENKKQDKDMKKITIIIILITLASKLFGFFREFVLSYFYGAGKVSDAFIIANTIPTSIIAFIGVAIASVYLPRYSKLETESLNFANSFTDKILTMLISLSIIIILVGYFFTEGLISIFAFGFDEETFKLSKQFTQITFLSVVFLLLTPIFQTLLNKSGKYHYSSLSGFPLNFVVIISIFLSYYINIYFLPIGIVLGSFLQMAFLYFFVRKNNYKFKPNSFVKDENIKIIIVLALPVFFGVAVNQINLIIDRSLASTVAVGGVTAMNYANKINWLIQGAFSTTIATIYFTEASKDLGNTENVQMKLKRAVSDLNMLIAPSMILCLFFSEQIIRFLFMRGNFDTQALELTTGPLLYYSIGFIGFAYREVFSRTYYLLNNTKTPVITAFIGMVINVILNFLLVSHMGLSGLALATSISAILSSLLLLFGLRNKKYDINISVWFVINSLIKYSILFLIPLIMLITFSKLLNINVNDYFLYLCLLATLVYIFILHLRGELSDKFLLSKYLRKKTKK